VLFGEVGEADKLGECVSEVGAVGVDDRRSKLAGIAFRNILGE